MGRDRQHQLPGSFRVVRCRTCGLVRTDPRPTADTISNYYPDEYGPYVGTIVDSRSRDEPPAGGVKRRLRRLFDLRTQSIPSLRPGRMLELGCASGSFLYEMAGRGWTVEGIEPSTNAAARATALGFKVQNASLENALPPDEHFDLVVGWMVLEHLHEPVAALEKVRAWTSPSGWLAVSTPSTRRWHLKLFGDAWYSLSLPHHLYHYTPASLSKILERAGWKVERAFHQRTISDLAASSGYLLQKSGRNRRLAEWLIRYPVAPGRQHLFAYPVASILAALGQTGRMTVWARPA
ncbi:MAG: class I SAM-dependent methyltransferase [Actinobacteria bacterium]|nr:class I SAM-dependent methyltransferase [Actinomycetota bacterium]